MKKRLIFYSLFFVVLAAGSCTDKNAVIDQNMEVPGQNWTYLNKYKFDVNINDAAISYNLYINLRVTGDYKYSNLFVLVSESGPDKKPTVKRFELTLADKEGAWLGEGSGNLYSFQIPFLTQFKFPVKGTYHFYVEQNMRDNPLRDVSDVGLRVERAEP